MRLPGDQSDSSQVNFLWFSKCEVFETGCGDLSGTNLIAWSDLCYNNTSSPSE